MGIYLSKHNFVRRLGKQIWAVCGVVSVAAMSFITATGKDLDMISIVEIVAALAISIFIIMSVTHIYFWKIRVFKSMWKIFPGNLCAP